VAGRALAVGPSLTLVLMRQLREAFAPQLIAYGEAPQRVGRNIRGCWFHFPVGGVVVEVSAGREEPLT